MGREARGSLYHVLNTAAARLLPAESLAADAQPLEILFAAAPRLCPVAAAAQPLIKYDQYYLGAYRRLKRPFL